MKYPSPIRTSQRGFIALISAIIISTILLALAVSIGSSTFFSRFDVLNSEYKRISLGLAEACVNQALSKIGNDYTYTGNETVPLGSAYGTTLQCTIAPITTPTLVNGKRTFTISTKASFLGAFSNVSVSAAAQDPASAPVVPPPSCALNPTGISVPAYQSVTVAWSTSGNPTSFSMDHGIGSLTPFTTGSVTFTPSPSPGDTTYTATVSNAGGSSPCTILVTVSAPPPSPSCADTFLMLDRTSSMFGDSPFFNNHPEWIADEKTAAKSLVSLYTGISPAPRVGIGHFADVSGTGAGASVAAALTTSLGGLPAAIDSALANISNPPFSYTYTNLGAAIGVSDGELGSARHDPTKQKVLILVSDGGANIPTSSQGSTPVGSPSAATQNASGDAWTNPLGAYADGSTDASDNGGHKERLYNFNFPTIPAGSTIAGIVATADAWSTVGPVASQLVLSPAAIGNFDQWSTNSGSNSGPSKLTALSASGGTYLVAGNNGTAETVSVSTSGIPAGATITGVTITALAAESGGTAGVSLRAENGTGVSNRSDDASHSLSNASFAPITRTMATNPISGSAWTSATLSAMRFGVVRTNTTGGTPRIDQITVTVTYTSIPTSSGCQLGVDLSWDGGNTWTSEKTATLTGAETTFPLGSATDDWSSGHTWSAAEFGNSNFRARIHDIDPGSSCEDTATTHLDWLRLQVFYTQSTDPSQYALNAAAAAKSNGVTIFGIHFGDPSGQNFMESLSSPSLLPSISIASAVRSGTTVTVTTSGIHRLTANERIVVSGISNSALNGTFTVSSVVNGTSFKYTTSGSGTVSATGGSVAPTNLFIAPSSSAMAGIFQSIGTQICPAASPACSNTVDDDGDGLVDEHDPGCHTDGNATNAASYDSSDNDEWEAPVAPVAPPPPPPPPNITLGSWVEVP